MTLLLPAPPRDPIDLEKVVEMYPHLRQSLLATFDNCHLSALFDLRYGKGWNTHPQSRGQMFHRFAAETLRTMRKAGMTDIPVREALEILKEVLRQRDLPVEERIRVPLREIALLRMAVIKFAHDNSFSIDKILDIERRLAHPIVYDAPSGPVARILTGQLDVLLAAPPDGAVVIDWKDTWALPPEDIEQEDDGHPDKGDHISYEGYFQQRFYGFLVMKAYPAVQWVTLREFYPRKTKVREATVWRATDLEHIEDELAIIAEEFDAVIGSGTRHAGTLSARDTWRPSPGRHCGFCVRRSACPIEERAKGEGMIRNAEMAKTIVGEYEVADKIRYEHRQALMAWTRVNGPVMLRDAKGRRWAGWIEREKTVKRKDGTPYTRTESTFGIWTGQPPEASVEDIDRELEQAMRDSVAETRRLREVASA